MVEASEGKEFKFKNSNLDQMISNCTFHCNQKNKITMKYEMIKTFDDCFFSNNYLLCLEKDNVINNDNKVCYDLVYQ